MSPMLVTWIYVHVIKDSKRRFFSPSYTHTSLLKLFTRKKVGKNIILFSSYFCHETVDPKTGFALSEGRLVLWGMRGVCSFQLPVSETSRSFSSPAY